MKKNIFKIFAVILIMTMTFSLTACSSLLSGLFNLGSGMKDQSTDESSTDPTLNEEELDQQLENAGALTGAITISMLWSTTDDLDLHVYTPGGEEIYFSYPVSSDGGTLDVDMQAYEDEIVASPVENVYFQTPLAGNYQIYVVDYNDRTVDSTTSYLVRVTVGDVSETFEGTIDGTDTNTYITDFDY